MGPRIESDERQQQRQIWIVRHGQRIDNIDSIWRENAPRGAWDDPTLSIRGLAQAEECGTRLAREEIDVLLCSPFIRCVQTASAISLKYPKELPIFIEPGICESLHVCQNPPGYLSPEELKDQFPSISTAYSPIVKIPATEKNEIECKDRLSKVLDETQRRYSGNILFVSHGAPIAVMHELLSGEWHYVGQCTISKFTSKPRGLYKTILRGDSSHLSDQTNLREREIQKPYL